MLKKYQSGQQWFAGLKKNCQLLITCLIDYGNIQYLIKLSHSFKICSFVISEHSHDKLSIYNAQSYASWHCRQSLCKFDIWYASISAHYIVKVSKITIHILISRRSCAVEEYYATHNITTTMIYHSHTLYTHNQCLKFKIKK